MPWLDEPPPVAAAPPTPNGKWLDEAPTAAPVATGGRFLDTPIQRRQPGDHPEVLPEQQLETPQEFQRLASPPRKIQPLEPDKGLLQISKLTPSAQTVMDALQELSSGSPDLTPDEAQAVEMMRKEPDKMSKVISGSLSAINKASEGMTTPRNVALLGGTAALPATGIPAAGRVASGLFAADMARQFPDLYQRTVDAFKTGDAREQAEALGDLILSGTFTGLAGVHALKRGPVTPETGPAAPVRPAPTGGHWVDEAPPAPEAPPSPPADVTADSLRELEAALRGNQLKPPGPPNVREIQAQPPAEETPRVQPERPPETAPIAPAPVEDLRQAARTTPAATPAEAEEAAPVESEPLLTKLQSLFDERGQNLRGGDYIGQLIAEAPTEQIIDAMRWARSLEREGVALTPYRIIGPHGAEALAARGVPVNSIGWQVANLFDTGSGAGAESPLKSGETPVGPPAVPETITGRDVRGGTEMPAERGAEVQPLSPSPEPPARVSRRTAQEANRPPDILDFISDEVGKIRSKSGSTAGEGLYEGDDYAGLRSSRWGRKVLTTEGRGVPPDVAAQAAFEAGWIKEPTADALWEGMRRAVSGRAPTGEKTLLDKQAAAYEAQHKDWQQQALKGPKTQGVRVDHLLEGDEFTVDGAKVRVSKLETDAAGNLVAVVLEDGRRFETQRAAAGDVIYPDKGRVGRATGTLSAKQVERQAIDPWAAAAEPEREALQMAAPESVEEQRQRLEAEEAKRQGVEQRQKLEERAAKPLVGTQGDIGQGDLLGGGDLFSQAPPDRVESILDSLKADIKPGELHAFGLVPEIWNGLIETVRLAYRAGKSVAEAVRDGIEWLRRTHPDAEFDQEGARNYLEGELNRRGAEILPETPHGLSPERLDEIATEARGLRDRARVHRAAGEPVPQELSDRLWELQNLLDEASHNAPRMPGGMREGMHPTEVRMEPNPRAGERLAGSDRPIPPFRGQDRLPREWGLHEMWSALQSARQRIGDWYAGRNVRRDLSALKDAAETRAKIFGRQAGNLVRVALGRAFNEKPSRVRRPSQLREYALTFAVEADRNPSMLRAFHEEISNSEFANTRWGQRALRAIEYANEHWEQLQPVVEVYRRITEAQRETEVNSGINTLEWGGGYVMHAQAGEGLEGVGAAPGQPQAAGQPFRHIRDYPTYAQAIAAGHTPRSLNAVDLLARRTAAGQKVLNEMGWLDGLRRMIDPRSQMPLATDPIYRIRADGTQDITAPSGYTLVRIGPAQFALHNAYVGVFNDLTNPSWWRSSGLRAGVQQAFATSKHLTLLGDTFHLGRLAFWRSIIGWHHGVVPGIPGYEKGVTLLDYTVADIREMARRGEIPADWAKDLEENRAKLDLALKSGFNVGAVSDNLYSDWIQKIPGFGTFNRWLFEQYQRGAMAESWLIEFERLRKAMPNATDEQVASRVSRDLNTRFGNLGSQGLFRSKTGQDLARLVFLAPQWNESLIRSEIGSLVQLGRLPFDSYTQRRLVVGTLLKATGTMILGQFIANQLINYATRGQPTWDNKEEGFGAKVSAWIPDVVGNGPGFFLNPMSIAAEIAHLVERKLERSQGVSDAALQILNSRLSGPARAASIFVTRKDAIGRSLREPDVLPAMGKALIPLPISAGAVGAAAKQLVTGEHQEQFAGQFQKQALATFGIKADQAPNPEQRMRGLAQEFNQSKGITPSAEFYASDFYALTEALRRGNATDAKEALEELLTKKTRQQILEHYQRWINAPYTGQRAREGEFMRGLTAEQRQQYLTSRERRRELARAAYELLRSMPRTPAPAR